MSDTRELAARLNADAEWCRANIPDEPALTHLLSSVAHTADDAAAALAALEAERDEALRLWKDPDKGWGVIAQQQTRRAAAAEAELVRIREALRGIETAANEGKALGHIGYLARVALAGTATDTPICHTSSAPGADSQTAHTAGVGAAPEAETPECVLPAFAGMGLCEDRCAAAGRCLAAVSSREEALLQPQLDAVDKALGPWEPDPESEVGCVGRVQTILNLKAREEALRDALLVIEHWPFDVNVTPESDLRAIKEHARRALAVVPGEDTKP